MFDPVYCVSCKKELDPAWISCPHCGSSQKPSAVAQPPPMPPPAHSQPAAAQPVYIVQQVPNVQLILDECTRQYQNLTWLQFAGIFFLGAYLIGLAMIIYAMVQKPALRRRVAELGVDPEQWEKPLRESAYKLLRLGIIIVAVGFVLGLIITAIIMSNTGPSTPEP